MTQLKLNPLSMSLFHGNRGSQILFERRLREMFDQYGFALITDVHSEMVRQTFQLKKCALPYFLDPVWQDEVVAKWPLRKHGQLGPTSEYEEKHLDPASGEVRDKGELKRYVSVDAKGQGWEVDDEVRALIPQILSKRYSIGIQISMAYENAHGKKPGTLSNMLSLCEKSYTTARVQWYPSNGYSITHTDKCAITVLDFEPGLQIEYPQGSGTYVELEGANPGDIVINLGDTFSRMLYGEGVLSTRHQVVVPETCPEQGRIVFPLFIHAAPDAVFPDGENVKAWCEREWSRESHVGERAV